MSLGAHQHAWLPFSEEVRRALCGERVMLEHEGQTWEDRKRREMHLPACEWCAVAEAVDRLSGCARVVCPECRGEGRISIWGEGECVEVTCGACMGLGVFRGPVVSLTR